MTDANRREPFDGLLAPTITNEVLPDPAPYRVQSGFFVGFFGGALAALLVHATNARRLVLPEEARRRLLIEGAVSAVILLVAAAVAVAMIDGPSPRLFIAGSGVLQHLLLSRHLAARERHWDMRGVQHASLWGFGLLCVLAGAVVSVVVVSIAVAAV